MAMAPSFTPCVALGLFLDASEIFGAGKRLQTQKIPPQSTPKWSQHAIIPQRKLISHGNYNAGKMPSGERRRRVQSTSDLQHLAFLKKSARRSPFYPRALEFGTLDFQKRLR